MQKRNLSGRRLTSKRHHDWRVLAELHRQLEQGHLPWPFLAKMSTEIVLFGSRAQDCANSDSDWDLLCVGHGVARRVGSVHIVWITPNQVHTAAWLGSELAGHVAAYGVWLLGTGDWRERVFVSPMSVAHKQQLVKARLRALAKYAHDLAPARLAYYGLRIRRDVQRMCILLNGGAVPSSPRLDGQWEGSMSRKRWMNLCFSLDIDGEVARLTWQIVSLPSVRARSLRTKRSLPGLRS